MTCRIRELPQRPIRRLNYGYITLVPVDNGEYPYTEYPNCWHVPGRQVLNTIELTVMGRQRNLVVTITEETGSDLKTTHLA